ncbi:hypothetical protein MBLNU230_g5221t1 [Neophaeotheca triangularis]
MSDSKLDQIVKGAPPPSISPTQVANNIKTTHPNDSNNHQQPPQNPSSTRKPSITAPQPPQPQPSNSPPTSDPRDNLPSAPPQIYLNLLILESSLRQQYLALRARLRLHLLLITALTTWLATFTYLLFLRPREDGSGVGGSVYWVVETGEKLAWTGGMVTAVLVWGTGVYERGVRWPRRWVGQANRGLRGFNLKVVVVRDGGGWSLRGWVGVMDLRGWVLGESGRVRYRTLPGQLESLQGAGKAGNEGWNSLGQRFGLVEEDVAPGGDGVRLLLLPKPFSPDFREGWDGFRAEYWERENARRAGLRRLVKARSREVARREGGWFWWTGWRGWRTLRGLVGRKSRRQVDLELLALREWPSPEERLRDRERRRKEGLLRPESHSRNSSRSSTPATAAAAAADTTDSRRRSRRGSSAAASARRPRKSGLHSHTGSRLSATESVFGLSAGVGEESGRPRGLTERESRGGSDSTGSEEGVVKKEVVEGGTPRSSPEVGDGVEVKVESEEA